MIIRLSALVSSTHPHEQQFAAGSVAADAPPDNRTYVERRLQGTVWEAFGAAHWIYRSVLSLAGALSRLGVGANALTYASLVFAALSGVLCGFSQFGWAALSMLTSGTCDVLDGALARASGTSSRYGALLDSTIDRLADGLPLLGLIAAFSSERWLSVLPGSALLVSFVVPYVRARAEGLGSSLPPLFMRRGERVVLLVVSLSLGEVPFGPVPAPLLLVGLLVMTLLGIAGAWSALRAARQALRLDAGSSKPMAAAGV